MLPVHLELKMASERAAPSEAEQHRAQVMGHWPYAVMPQSYHLVHGIHTCTQHWVRLQ